MTDDASRATPPPGRDQQLLAIGKQCSHASCNLVDFLPFKCQHCQESFCQEHFKVETHKCPNYDASKHDRIAPSCPLCNTPVAIPPGQDPNVRMENHFVKECSVMLGKETKKLTPTCARAKCGKVLYAPIRCDKCSKLFCPAHRFPGDHTCSPLPRTQMTRPGAPTANSRLLNLNAKINEKASAASNATVGAVRKTMGFSASPSSSQPAATTTGSSAQASGSSSPKNPFSKTDSPTSAFAASPSPSLTSRSNDINDHTTETSKPHTTTPIQSKPKPVIRSSYIPSPIFATA